MKIKYQIAFGASVIITLLYVLPWISMAGELEHLRSFFPAGNGKRRILFLSLSVFLSSILFFQYNFFWKNRWLRANSKNTNVFFHAVVNIFLAIVLAFFIKGIYGYLLGFKNVFLSFYLFRNFFIALVSMLVVYVYEKIEQAKQDRINLLMLNNEKVESELNSLKKQIDPHFLFNCFNSLTGLIREDQKEAVRFVNHLSDTFRYVLDHHQNNLITLKQELDFLDSYLFMMKVRFRNGFHIQINVDEKDLHKRIPQFGLQLLVENAVKHNLISERKPLFIHIKAVENYVIVTNNIQLKTHTTKGYGIGLVNLTKQYELLGSRNIRIMNHNNHFAVNLPLL